MVDDRLAVAAAGAASPEIGVEVLQDLRRDLRDWDGPMAGSIVRRT
ncbi:MAG: hypothetical protein L0H84_12640 [Pseudonocardia sp.]|nr:hypothetical protein [Pseudonocardia sp.]